MHSDRLGTGSYENDIIFFAQLGKICIFRQKSEAGVNRLSSCHFACLYDSCGVKVAVLCCGRTYAHSLVGDLGVEGVLIRSGMDRYGMYSQLSARSYYSHGDLASVCYKNLFKHFIQSLSVTLLQRLSRRKQLFRRLRCRFPCPRLWVPLPLLSQLQFSVCPRGLPDGGTLLP